MNRHKFAVTIILIASFAFFSIPNCTAEELKPKDLSAKGAVVIEQDTGEILYGKNENTILPMASTTKIMTALLALECLDPESEITVTAKMAKVEGSSIYLEVGDYIKIKDLVYGLMLESGNDAAVAIAITTCGNCNDFAKLMNARAKKIGVKDTNFVTPNGLDDENHYTTPYDLALITAEAMKNKQFAEIVSTKKVTVKFGNPKVNHYFTNHNKMLSYYEGSTGVKTGFTKKSGRCLVSSATRDNINLVCVTLNAPNDWSDHKKMLNYGFEDVAEKSVTIDTSKMLVGVIGGKQDTVTVNTNDTLAVAVKKTEIDDVSEEVVLPRFVFAPVYKGQKIGEIRYTINGIIIKTQPLLAIENIEKNS